MTLSAATLIEQLKLEPHVEGGYFRRTYNADHLAAIGPTRSADAADSEQQSFCSAIYYLLCSQSPIGHLHRNRSDILHFHHSGQTLKYTLISPSGEISDGVMGLSLRRRLLNFL